MANPEITNFLDKITPPNDQSNKLRQDFKGLRTQTALELSNHVLKNYGIDITGNYAGIKIAHPFGKAAGQLSMTSGHIKADFENGLAFSVMKSAVGVTVDGDIGIDGWERSAPKMIVESRTSKDGRDGWTVTWKGRGWDKGFTAYADFYSDVLAMDTPGHYTFPSLMVDVTDRDRAIDQCSFCLKQLTEIHEKIGSKNPFTIEIDISPTLNLLPGAENDDTFRQFAVNSVAAFYHGLPEPHKFIVKIPNADRGPEFQLQLVKDSIEEGKERLAGIIIGNRLFDPKGEFEGQVGIAYGGWDLSNANLETLDLMLKEKINVPLIATGNIGTGRMMVEYALRGCTAGEIHTFFQLSPSSYRAPKGDGGRIWRAMREIMFHPDDGLIAIMLKLETASLLTAKNEILYFSDLPSIYNAVANS